MLYMQPRATVALVGVATLNLALPAPLQIHYSNLPPSPFNVVLLWMQRANHTTYVV